MFRKWAVSIALSCAATNVFASDWLTVIDGPDAQLSVDVASIVRQGPTVKAWIRRVNTPPKYIAEFQSKVGQVKTTWIFNCQQKTMHIGTLIVTDDKGATVRSRG